MAEGAGIVTADAARVAQAIKVAAGHRDPRMPSDEDLVALADAYLELARGARPQLYVTLAAAREYAAEAGVDGLEEARRELTELLLLARPTSDPSRWRRRVPDLEARVVIEGQLAVVTHVHLRGRPAPRPDRRR